MNSILVGPIFQHWPQHQYLQRAGKDVGYRPGLGSYILALDHIPRGSYIVRDVDVSKGHDSRGGRIVVTRT